MNYKIQALLNVDCFLTMWHNVEINFLKKNERIFDYGKKVIESQSATVLTQFFLDNFVNVNIFVIKSKLKMK